MKRAILALIGALAACSRSAPTTSGQIAILRFENLTGDAALDWMGRGAARALAAQINEAVVADSPQPAEERELSLTGGNRRVLHGYLSVVNGHLRVRADLETPSGPRFQQSAEATGAVADGLPPLATAVARALDPKAQPPATKSNAALEAYVAALDATTRDSAIASFERAIAADPGFAGPYLALAELYESRQDRAAAERLLTEAKAHSSAFAPVDRARVDASAAQLAGDPAALSKALTTLLGLTPDDTRLLRALAELETQAKRFNSAAGYLRRALAAQPDDAALLNNLGYTLALGGDLDGAAKALVEYSRQRPDDPNPLDSLGDVHFYWNRFAEAAQFYRQEYKKDPAFLNGGSMFKASAAVLFSGDAKTAEATFAEYEAARRAASDPLVDFNRIFWDYLRGRRSDATANMESLAAHAKTGDLQTLAHSTLTIWFLESGDREKARQHAALAKAAASSPAMSALAMTSILISAPTKAPLQSRIQPPGRMGCCSPKIFPPQSRCYVRSNCTHHRARTSHRACCLRGRSWKPEISPGPRPICATRLFQRWLDQPLSSR